MIAEIIGVGTAPESEETLSSNAALIVRELEACGISAGPCTWAGGAGVKPWEKTTLCRLRLSRSPSSAMVMDPPMPTVLWSICSLR